jgi:hypothetical protein
MAELTKTIDGKPHSADDFAYVGDAKDISTWHLPIDKEHIDSALKMFGHEKNVPADAKVATAHKIVAEAKKQGLDEDRIKNFEEKYCKSVEHGEAPRGWIEIFRAGDYRPQGKINITRQDLERVVRNYDPDFHEAPVCVGHPKTDAPAFGWIERLALDGDTLLAKEKQVDPAFDEARKTGRYKKRSAAFYLDADGKVGGLRHVGWLGAQPPEVKGLKNLNFDDAGREFVELAFGEEETVGAENDKSIGEQISAWFAEHVPGFGKGASKEFSEADVKRIATEAITAATAPLQTKISELETSAKAQTAKFAERETAIATGETKARVVEAINKLTGEGKWVPAFDRAGLPLVFEELAKATTTIEFGEADQDGKKPQVAPFQMLVEFMEGLKKIVPNATFYEGGKVSGGSKSSGDPLTDAAHARMKENPKLNFGEALDEVVAEKPELTMAGGMSAGSV